MDLTHVSQSSALDTEGPGKSSLSMTLAHACVLDNVERTNWAASTRSSKSTQENGSKSTATLKLKGGSLPKSICNVTFKLRMSLEHYSKKDLHESNQDR